jgi:hypothetical protein
MNELETLSRFRDEVPASRPWTGPQDVIMAAIRAERGPAPAAVDPARPMRPARRPWRARGGLIVAGLAAAGVAGAVILVAAQPGQHSPPSSRHSAQRATHLRLGPARTEAQLVAYASRLAASAPGSAPRPDQWIYARTESAASSDGGGGFLFGPPNRRVFGREWFRADGKLDAADVHGHLRFGRAGLGTMGGWKSVSYAYLNSLPASPKQLEAVILAENIPRMPWYDAARNHAIFAAIANLFLGEQDGVLIPPKLKADLYRLLSVLPGVRFDRTTDLAGRRGIGFFMKFGWYKQEVVINPKTYAYMGDEFVAIRAHASVALDGTWHIKKGQVLGWGALLRIAVVQRAGQLP